MVIGKCTDVLRGIFFVEGGGEGAMLKDLYLEEFITGKEKFHEGSAGFSRII